MRVYTAISQTVLNSGSRLEIPAGSMVWGVSEKLVKSGDEREETEYEALAECVLVEASARDGEEALTRVICAACDIEESILDPAPADLGEWGFVTRAAAVSKVAAWFVSELDAKGALESEYAPEMLWFDPSEPEAANEYASGPTSAMRR